jgi:hypothetical protein
LTVGALALAVTAWCTGEARADCTPASASNITATCSGTTTNQGGGAPGTSAATNGYGTGAQTGVTVNVNQGATVTGTLRGIFLGGGTVTNLAGGQITGTGGVYITGATGTVMNAGTVAGTSGNGTFILNGGSVTNLADGQISSRTGVGVGFGVGGAGTVTNAGTISSGGSNAVGFSNGGTVTNLAGGQITGRVGISASGGGSVTNAGAITGTSASGGTGIRLDSGAITNLSGGQITAARGIQILGGVGNITNAGTITGTDTGALGGSITLFNGGNVTNQAGGVINGGTFIQGGPGTIVNAGMMIGQGGNNNFGEAVFLNMGGSVTNLAGGLMTGWGGVVASINPVTVINAGTIVGFGTDAASNGGGISLHAGGSVTNLSSGLITGGVFGVNIQGAGSISNAGTIIGTAGPAILFQGGPDTLTLLPGSKIIGAITLSGVSDNVNVNLRNQNLTFNSLAGATVTSTLPFVRTGTQIVTIDPTPFAASGILLNDFARGVSGMLPSFDGPAAPGGARPLAFAGSDTASRVEEAFAGIPGLSAYAKEPMVFKNATVTYQDGTSLWMRGFGGEHRQQADGLMLRNLDSYYGGAIGVDRAVWANLRIGGFIGAGHTRSVIDPTNDSTDSNLVFGGAYARYLIGASFLDAAVQVGGMRSSTSRMINNNLAATGVETAGASYDSWYLSPELTFGHRFALGALADSQYALTPSLQVRYLYGSFGGYTETGSTANMTVNGWTTQQVEERAELKLTRTTLLAPTALLLVNVTGGALATERVGGNGVSAALLGQPLPFATPGQDNVWGGFGGFGLELQHNSVSMFMSGEYLALTNAGSIVSGKGGLRVSF